MPPHLHVLSFIVPLKMLSSKTALQANEEQLLPFLSLCVHLYALLPAYFMTKADTKLFLDVVLLVLRAPQALSGTKDLVG